MSRPPSRSGFGYPGSNAPSTSSAAPMETPLLSSRTLTSARTAANGSAIPGTVGGTTRRYGVGSDAEQDGGPLPGPSRIPATVSRLPTTIRRPSISSSSNTSAAPLPSVSMNTGVNGRTSTGGEGSNSRIPVSGSGIPMTASRLPTRRPSISSSSSSLMNGGRQDGRRGDVEDALQLNFENASGKPSAPSTVSRLQFTLKRDSSSAGFVSQEQASPKRFAQSPSLESAAMTSKIHALESEILSMKRAALSSESTITEMRRQAKEREERVALLENDRETLLRREQSQSEEVSKERADREEREKKLRDETKSLREKVERYRSEVVDLREENSSLSHRLEQATLSEKQAVQRADNLEREMEGLTNELRESEEVSDQEKRKNDELTRELEDARKKLELAERGESEEKGSLAIVRDQLNQQVNHIRTLEQANARLTKEVTTYKSHYQNIEVLKEEKIGLETRIRILEDTNEKSADAEREIESYKKERAEWTAYLSSPANQEFTSPHSLARALAASRLEVITLTDKLGNREADVQSRNRLIEELEGKIGELEREKDEIEEAREKDRSRAERAERDGYIGRKEVEMLKKQVESYAAEESSLMASYDKTKTAQIDQLNELLGEHKKRISELANERDHLRDELENRVRDVANLQEALALATNKNSEDGEVAGDVSMASVTSEAITGTPRSARKRRDFGGKSKISETLAQQIRQNEELNNELEEIAEENALLSKTVESLQLQVDRLSHDLGRGEYNPDTTRILALADNPSAKDLAIRTETLERLREENKALLAKVVELEQGGASGAVVPLATLEGLQKENKGLKGDVALALKKNDRLRQAFAQKADEFRETIYSLFGYQVKFLNEGRVRLTSAYSANPSHALIFEKPPNNQGPMRLVGGDNEDFALGPQVKNLTRLDRREGMCSWIFGQPRSGVV